MLGRAGEPPPALVLFSVGPMALLPFKPLLPLPADSSCASSPVSEVAVVFWGKLRFCGKLCFCGKSTLCVSMCVKLQYSGVV